MSIFNLPILDVTCVLWGDCALGCDFCYQKNWNKQVIKKTDFKLEVFIDKLVDFLNKYNTYDIKLDFLGGELFEDNLFTEVFPIIQKKLLDLKLNYTEVVINSNLIIKDIFPLLETINTSNGFITNIFVSYDFYGRFKTVEQIDLFLKNFKSLVDSTKNIEININTVCTKPGINVFLNPQTELEKYTVDVFEEIYKYCLDKDTVGYVVDKNNLYIPTSLENDFLEIWSPSYKEYISYVKFLIKNYPHKNVIRESFENKNKYVSFCNDNCWLYVNNNFDRMCNLDLYSIENFGIEITDQLFLKDRCQTNFDGPYCDHYYYCTKFDCKLFTASVFDRCWKKEIYECLKG